MRSSSFARIVFCTLIVGSLLLPWLVAAQGANQQTVINYPETFEVQDQNALALRLYFTITDVNGQVVANPAIKSASILLDDGKRYDNVQIERPTSPFYVVLALDTSGSMQQSIAAMRQAAIDSVGQAPQQAAFSVVTFNDSVTTLSSDFTSDRNAVVGLINQVKPPPNQTNGTCLYDAAYQSIQLLSKAPVGRRAVILFTDGRDETLQNANKPCSSHSYDELIALATKPEMRVPIHTIGLRGTQDFRETELRGLAEATGGLFGVGSQDNLAALFRQVMIALTNQYSATAMIFPDKGTRTANLFITLNDGSSPLAGLTRFTVDKSFMQTPTPMVTQDQSTPIPVSAVIDTIQLDRNANEFIVQVNVQREDLIGEYIVEFVDASGLLQQAFSVPAPLKNPLHFPATKLVTGDYDIVVRAYDKSRQQISQNDKKVKYQAPVITPSATPTQEPVGATLQTIQVDEANHQFILNVQLVGAAKIKGFRVQLINAKTNQLVKEYTPPPAATVTLGTEDVPPGDYNVTLLALGDNGQQLSQSVLKFSFVVTPTPTVAATLTPTAVKVGVSIAGIRDDQVKQQFELSIQTQNEALIQSYRVQFVSKATGLVVGEYEIKVPPYDMVHVPVGDLKPGEYLITLKALDDKGDVLAQTQQTIAYTPPPTAAVTPTPAPTPTPVPPTVIDTVIHHPATLPFVIVIIVVITLLIAALLIRNRRTPKEDDSWRTPPTGQYPVGGDSMTPGGSPSYPAGSPGGSQQYAANASSPYGKAPIPTSAQITVKKSADRAKVRQTFTIGHSPYKIGRVEVDGSTDRDLTFADPAVSRRHAEITFENGRFYIEDCDSRYGTTVDKTSLTGGSKAPLRDGAIIQLGTRTTVMFQVFDPGKTNDGVFDPGKTNDGTFDPGKTNDGSYESGGSDGYGDSSFPASDMDEPTDGPQPPPRDTGQSRTTY